MELGSIQYAVVLFVHGNAGVGFGGEGEGGVRVHCVHDEARDVGVVVIAVELLLADTEGEDRYGRAGIGKG